MPTPPVAAGRPRRAALPRLPRPVGGVGASSPPAAPSARAGAPRPHSAAPPTPRRRRRAACATPGCSGHRRRPRLAVSQRPPTPSGLHHSFGSTPSASLLCYRETVALPNSRANRDLASTPSPPPCSQPRARSGPIVGTGPRRPAAEPGRAPRGDADDGVASKAGLPGRHTSSSSPAGPAVTDSIVLSQRVDATVLIVWDTTTTSKAAHRCWPT